LILRAYKALLGGFAMVVYMDECVGCGRPCMGLLCPHKNVKHLVCDGCGEEDDVLYEDGQGTQLCKDCVLEGYKRVCLWD